MTRVVLSPEADLNLQDIWLAIASDNPATATRMVRAIGVRIDQLADHPRLGPRRRDIRPAARMLVEGAYLILFETVPDTDDGPIDRVEIIRVLDGRRNLTRLI
jgi:toxin ParE1/3/4